MGFWLMPEPEAYLKGVVQLPRYRDLGHCVDTLTHLENTKVFTGYPDLYSPAMGTPGLAGLHKFLVHGPESRDAEYQALIARGAPPQDYEPYALRNALPFWSAGLPFYGPEKVIRAQWDMCRNAFAPLLRRRTFEEREFFRLPLTEAQKETMEYPAQLGIPNLRTFQIGARSPWNPAPPGDGHMWFSPIIPRTAEAILQVNEVMAPVLREVGASVGYAMNVPIPAWERSSIFVIGFPISKVPGGERKTRAAFRRVVQVAAEHGWGEYRLPWLFRTRS